MGSSALISVALLRLEIAPIDIPGGLTVVKRPILRVIGCAVLCAALMLVPVSFQSASASPDHAQPASVRLQPFADLLRYIGSGLLDLLDFQKAKQAVSPRLLAAASEGEPQTDVGAGLDPSGLHGGNNGGSGAASNQ